MGHIDKNMERIVNIIQNVEGKMPKDDDVTQGYQEVKDSIHGDKPSINKHTLRAFNYNNRSN